MSDLNSLAYSLDNFVIDMNQTMFDEVLSSYEKIKGKIGNRAFFGYPKIILIYDKI